MATPEEFARQYGALAQDVGNRLKVSPAVLLGQWGLETGWGKSIIPGTNNLGNIKDFRGSGVAAVDNMTGSNDRYRQFSSPEDFGAHFVGLIERKYPNAIGAGDDAAAFAVSLKQGGYAEDPGYVDKISSVSKAAGRALGDDSDEWQALLSEFSGGQPAEAAGGEWEALINEFRAPPAAPAAQAEPPQAQPAQPAASASDGGVGAGIMMGLRDPIDAGAQMLRRAVPEEVGQAVDRAGNWLADAGFPVARSDGVQGVDNIVNQVNQQYEAGRQAAGRDGMDWARLGGNIAAATPLAVAAPAGGAGLAGRVAAGAAQGAAFGTLNPVIGKEAQSDFAGAKQQQAAIGGAFGAAAPVVTSAIGRLVSPAASRAGSQARMLADEGVQLTPGQAAGGTAMRLEDRLMSAPILGDAIRSARTRGNETLNRAVYNRVLAPIGEKTDKIGREAVLDASRKVSQAYDDVLSRVKFTPDNAFEQNIANLRSMAADLPEREAQQFERILQREVLGPLSKGRSIDGIAFKQIESQLTQRAAGLKGSTDAYQNDLGNAIGEVLRAMRENLVRLNPQYADRLSAVNESFANLVRLQNAAGKVGAQEGIFTPQQLANAIRSADTTKRKGAYAKGTALMQDLSDAAQSRMSSQIPNSGTADRFLLNAGALGSGVYNPFIPAGLAAASVPYLPGFERIATGAITNRPASAKALADALKKLPAGYFGLVAGQ